MLFEPLSEALCGSAVCFGDQRRVLEISSFQLDGIVDFKPHVAVITNITPDHLDRYEYKFEKLRLDKWVGHGGDEEASRGWCSIPEAIRIANYLDVLDVGYRRDVFGWLQSR